MEFNELIEAFAAKYGIEGLVPEDGVASIVVDGMKCMILDDEESDSIAVCGEIGHPPPDANGPFGELMLKANFLLQGSSGSVLSMSPQTGEYVVFRKIQRPSVDLDALSSAIEKVADQMTDWKNILNGMKEAEDKAKDQDHSKPEFSPFSPSGFMQV